MKKVIVLNKKEGETPLECLERFRQKNREYKNIPMTYAGRLDPMASGLLLILIGEECKNKEKYLNLAKEYEFTVLFGFSTDSYDILGKVLKNKIYFENKINLQKSILKEIKSFNGKFLQKYPVYSSRTVNGKPLFTYARQNKKVEIPEREVSVSSLRLKKLHEINGKNLLQNIEKRINKVKGPPRNAKGIAFAGGDFRQKEIIRLWKKNLKNKKENKFVLGNFRIKCSSGTYVRGITNSLGEKMGVPALAFTIKRTSLGRFKI